MAFESLILYAHFFGYPFLVSYRMCCVDFSRLVGRSQIWTWIWLIALLSNPNRNETREDLLPKQFCSKKINYSARKKWGNLLLPGTDSSLPFLLKSKPIWEHRKITKPYFSFNGSNGHSNCYLEERHFFPCRFDVQITHIIFFGQRCKLPFLWCQTSPGQPFGRIFFIMSAGIFSTFSRQWNDATKNGA